MSDLRHHLVRVALVLGLAAAPALSFAAPVSAADSRPPTNDQGTTTLSSGPVYSTWGSGASSSDSSSWS